ncbi:citrate transporter, partial [Candidatus Sumerlaeota bacterium]|nr:citrate transporter [Candidatus Sumerlaeota bacterium]
QSMIQGSASTLPAVLLMVGIGILITAVQGPKGWSDANGGNVWPVIAGIKPYFAMLPNTRLGYVVIFTVCAPLALYRGPLNTWGLGFGMATLLISGAGYPAAAVMGMLMTVGQIQGVCDPTNTANVWLANELRVDVMSLMWRTIPYIWVMGIMGLIISAFVFM